MTLTRLIQTRMIQTPITLTRTSSTPRPAILLVVSLIFFAITFLATVVTAEVALESQATGLVIPVAGTHAGDGRLFITHLFGIVDVWDGEQIQQTLFLDITDRVSDGGRGLWSIAFHPNFPETPWVFAHYAARGSNDSVISRFELSNDGSRLDPSSEVEVLRFEKPEILHFGGQLDFGADGYLYISTGDGSGSGAGPDPMCSAQSLDSLQGKLLRIDVDVDVPPYYRIPADNPFINQGRAEIWSYGLRNPWRFSFDRETDQLFLSDVGEDRREEINVAPSSRGANFGWKVMEGSNCFSGLAGCSNVPPCNAASLAIPEIEYAHGGGRCSVTGGYVYRGSLVPELYGDYIYGDFCSGEIFAARQVNGQWQSRLLPINAPSVASFAEDVSGELFVIGSGTLWRLVDAQEPAAGIVELTQTSFEIAESGGALSFDVRRVGDADGAVSVQVVGVSGSATAGLDFDDRVTTVSWAAGENGVRTVSLPILDDNSDESAESFTLELRAATGGAVIGARAAAQVTLLDDEQCVSGGAALCLGEGRFRATMSFRTADLEGIATAVDLTADAGYFWFFDEDNPEIFMKILNACGEPFNHYWVFVAGLTNVETRLEVTDRQAGVTRVYETALGQGYEAIRDTMAFATCP